MAWLRATPSNAWRSYRDLVFWERTLHFPARLRGSTRENTTVPPATMIARSGVEPFFMAAVTLRQSPSGFAGGCIR